MARGVWVVVELLLRDNGVIEQRVPALLDLPQGETTAEFHSQMNRGQICRLTEHTHNTDRQLCITTSYIHRKIIWIHHKHIENSYFPLIKVNVYIVYYAAKFQWFIALMLQLYINSLSLLSLGLLPVAQR
jgi:hypothetical protein